MSSRDPISQTTVNIQTIWMFLLLLAFICAMVLAMWSHDAFWAAWSVLFWIWYKDERAVLLDWQSRLEYQRHLK